MAERSKLKSVLVVYFALVLDNILLTVVVPVIPVFLHQVEHSTTYSEVPTYKDYPGVKPFLRSIRVAYPGEAPFYLPPNQTLIIVSPKLVSFYSNKPGFQKERENPRNVSRIPASVDLDKNNSMMHKTLMSEKMINENGRVGFLFASKAFVQLVANPLVGYCTMKKGYHLPFICGTAILLLSSIIFASVSNYLWLLLARSLQGVASACISVAGMGLVAQLYNDEHERSKIMGYVLGGIAVGVLIGYPLGGFLFDFVGESAPFVVISFATGILVAYQIIHFNQEYNIKATETDEESQSPAPVTYLKLLSNPCVLVATGSVWFSTTAMALLEPCLPIWLMDTIKPEKWQLGTVFLPDSFGYFIGTNFFALPALKIGRHRMAIIAMLCVGASAISIPFARTMWDLVMPHFFLGLGIGMVDSALMPLMAKIVDDSSSDTGSYGSMYAIVQTAVCLAYGLGPLLGGHLAARFGFPELMSAVGILNVAYTPLLLILGWKTRLVDVDQVGGDTYNKIEKD